MHNTILNYYDVIVIGAGPAGSVAARFAAEAGCTVLLLERDREPGIPVRCAEGVSHNGILPFIDINEKWICATIDGARFHSPDGNFLDMYHKGLGSNGYILDRRIFDRELADLAVSKGATLLTKADAIGVLKDGENITGVRFRHEKDVIEVSCKIVIGADGVESQVGRWAGIDTCLALSDVSTLCQYTVTNIKIESKICHFYLGQEIIPGGYLYIFPKSENSANIGVGMSGDKTLPGKGPRYYLDIFMKAKFPNASINCMVYGGEPSKAGNELVKNNVMLVGDAAAQADPITGGGIVHAMIAGKYSGKTAGRVIQNNDLSLIKEYPQKWENHLGKKQRFLYQLKNKVMKINDRKFNTIMAVCKKIPQEELTMQRIFKEVIIDDPLLLAKLATDFVISMIKA